MKNFSSLLFFFLILLASCGKKSALQFTDSSLQLSESDASFVALKNKILVPKCLSCHSESDTVRGISSWVVAGNPEASSLYTQTKNGSMPMNRAQLTGVELEMIHDFITALQAAPAPAPTPAPSSSGITFSQVHSRILTAYGCTSCHSVGTEAKLARWINKSSPASSSFYTSVKNGSMPQGGRAVSSGDQAFILQYLKDYSPR